jgi:hypothetical protein
MDSTGIRQTLPMRVSTIMHGDMAHQSEVARPEDRRLPLQTSASRSA